MIAFPANREIEKNQRKTRSNLRWRFLWVFCIYKMQYMNEMAAIVSYTEADGCVVYGACIFFSVVCLLPIQVLNEIVIFAQNKNIV